VIPPESGWGPVGGVEHTLGNLAHRQAVSVDHDPIGGLTLERVRDSL
jgi:hypothetical protein